MVILLFSFLIPFRMLKYFVAGQLIRQFISHNNQHKGYAGLEKPHGGSQIKFCFNYTDTVYIGINDISRGIYLRAVQPSGIFHGRIPEGCTG